MSDAREVAEVAGRLTEEDRKLFLNARVFTSGMWLGGPCRHLYGHGLCRLTGELEPLGLAVRAHLQKEQADG